MSRVVCKCLCDECSSSYYGESDKHVKVRSGENVGISLSSFNLTKLGC